MLKSWRVVAAADALDTMIVIIFSSIFAFFSNSCAFSPTPPIFLQLFLSSTPFTVGSAFFTQHTCTPFPAVQTFLPTCPYLHSIPTRAHPGKCPPPQKKNRWHCRMGLLTCAREVERREGDASAACSCVRAALRRRYGGVVAAWECCLLRRGGGEGRRGETWGQ